MQRKPWIISLLLTLLPTVTMAEIEFSEDMSDLSAAERAWLEDDSSLDSHLVNEGQIKWLPKAKTDSLYTLKNQLTLSPSSQLDGWVKFTQCHHQLDAISKVEIVYSEDTTRNLQVLSHQRIQQVVQQPFSVELTGVLPGAEICISGENKTLHKTATGWKLERGPYMRRFLDGYYPMQLQETLNWKHSGLELEPSSIQTHLGRESVLNKTEQQLHSNYWFEGILRTKYQFRSRAKNSPKQPK